MKASQIKIICYLFALVGAIGFVGCEDAKDSATPAQVTKQMEDQAKASDNFMMDQIKTKKASPSR